MLFDRGSRTITGLMEPFVARFFFLSCLLFKASHFKLPLAICVPLCLGEKQEKAANGMEEEVQTEEKQGREQTDKRSTGSNGLGAVSQTSR